MFICVIFPNDGMLVKRHLGTFSLETHKLSKNKRAKWESSFWALSPRVYILYNKQLCLTILLRFSHIVHAWQFLFYFIILFFFGGEFVLGFVCVQQTLAELFFSQCVFSFFALSLLCFLRSHTSHTYEIRFAICFSSFARVNEFSACILPSHTISIQWHRI